jgi:hypothetical protein
VRRKVGSSLIAAGVTVWVIYGVVWLTGVDPDPGAFLPFHLAGIIPGVFISRWPSRRGRRPATARDS